MTEALFFLTVRTAIRRRLIGARDLIIDSAPVLAWCRSDPDAAVGHAPAQHLTSIDFLGKKGEKEAASSRDLLR